MVFAAIAVVAFTGVSIANTKEVKKKYDETKKEIVKEDNCGTKAHIILDVIESQNGCLSTNEYNSTYVYLYLSCSLNGLTI